MRSGSGRRRRRRASSSARQALRPQVAAGAAGDGADRGRGRRPPGPGDRYNLRQPDSVIRRYLKAARKAKALLILDVQPGRSDFFTETKRLRKWLKEPDVGLALDPEWRMGPGRSRAGDRQGRLARGQRHDGVARPARERHNLPQKLLLVHEFTDDMVPEAELKPRKGLAYVLNVDGFGGQALKVAKYKELRQAGRASGAASSSSTKRTQADDVAAQVMRLSHGRTSSCTNERGQREREDRQREPGPRAGSLKSPSKANAIVARPVSAASTTAPGALAAQRARSWRRSPGSSS